MKKGMTKVQKVMLEIQMLQNKLHDSKQYLIQKIDGLLKIENVT